MLRLRLAEHKNDPKYKQFSEKLDELRKRMEENLITSIDFLRELLATAKEILEASTVYLKTHPIPPCEGGGAESTEKSV